MEDLWWCLVSSCIQNISLPQCTIAQIIGHRFFGGKSRHIITIYIWCTVAGRILIPADLISPSINGFWLWKLAQFPYLTKDYGILLRNLALVFWWSILDFLLLYSLSSINISRNIGWVLFFLVDHRPYIYRLNYSYLNIYNAYKDAVFCYHLCCFLQAKDLCLSDQTCCLLQ